MVSTPLAKRPALQDFLPNIDRRRGQHCMLLLRLRLLPTTSLLTRWTIAVKVSADLRGRFSWHCMNVERLSVILIGGYTVFFLHALLASWYSI
jgi:hypothetical protein